MSRRLFQTAALLVALGSATVACGDDGPDQARSAVGANPTVTTAHNETGSAASGEASETQVTPTGTVVDIVALDNQFRPQIVTVKVGDEVKWRNGGRNAHDILSIEGATWGIKLADFEPGDEYSRIFSEPGTYDYYCTVHGNEKAGMTGTVIVAN